MIPLLGIFDFLIKGVHGNSLKILKYISYFPFVSLTNKYTSVNVCFSKSLFTFVWFLFFVT